MTWLQNYKSTNFQFDVRAKLELPAFVQSILQKYKHGIHATSQDYRQAPKFDLEAVTKGALADSGDI